MKIDDKLIGKKFNHLTVVTFNHSEGKKNRRFFLCQCSCGDTAVVLGSHIISGNTKSCGCYRGKSRMLPKGEQAMNQVYADYKCKAKKRGRVFKLSKKQFFRLSQQKCHYCTAEPSNVRKSGCDNGDFKHNGIDRIDSSKGYLINNVVSCCAVCNTAKNDMSHKDFVAWVNRVHNHLTQS